MTPIRRYRGHRNTYTGSFGDRMMDLVDAALEGDFVEAPSPPPACPDCGGPCGDGDRVLYGRCGRCAGCYPNLPPVARSARRCWCGRKVSTLPDGNDFECSEHDGPLPATGPSTPLTPGGVFDRCYP